MSLITKLLLAFLYSLLFPVGQLLGDPYAGFGIVISLPFMAGAWIGGTAMHGLSSANEAYLVGASLAIFVQLAVILIFRHIRAHGLRPAT